MMLTDEEIDALWPEITLPQKVARREILRKGITANNAKVLADLKPVASSWQQHGKQVNVFPYPPPSEETWAYQNRNGYWTNKGFKHSPLYSADQVSALIQERDALAARVKELEAELTDVKDGIELASRGF